MRRCSVTTILALLCCAAASIHVISSQATYQRTEECEKQLANIVAELKELKANRLSETADLAKQLKHLQHDMNFLTRGSVLVQQNIDGSNFFNRSWAEFKAGFGSTTGNYWIGNQRLHELTSTGRYKLRFELQSNSTGKWYWAEYSTFTVSHETDKYRMTVDGFTDNAANDAFSYTDNWGFTTYDSDNDGAGPERNCALRDGGGFWYDYCAFASVNGVPGLNDGFGWHGLPGGRPLRSSRMWLVIKSD